MFYSYKVDSKLKLKIPMVFYAEKLQEVVSGSLPELMKWLAWPVEGYSIEHAMDYIRETSEKTLSSKGLFTLIFENGKIAGGISLHNFDTLNGCVEIGYWLGNDFQGRGIVSKCCCAMIDYAFEELGFQRVELLCEVGNEKSEAVALRLGFKEEGLLRKSANIRGDFRDQALYALLLEDWPGGDAALLAGLKGAA